MTLINNTKELEKSSKIFIKYKDKKFKIDEADGNILHNRRDDISFNFE